jgi:hypothetical protein
VGDINVVRVQSVFAICSDCGNGLFGGQPCEHKIRRAIDRDPTRDEVRVGDIVEVVSMEPLPPLTDADPKPQAVVIDDFPFVMLIRWIGDRPPHGHPREETRMFTDLRRVDRREP